MRRLLSTFADRMPSLGLLLLRVVVAAALILRFLQLHNRASVPTTAPHVIAAAIGLLLLFGSWTAVAGVMVAIIESVLALSHNGDPWVSVLLASLGVSLALLGPGTWSLDARRFGWKRIEIRRPDE
jgi:putative oxidoreductase